MKKLLLAAIPLAALAGCASSGGGSNAGTAAQAAAVAAPVSPSCGSQGISWRGNGGKTDLKALLGDMNDIESAAGALEDAADAGDDLSGPEASLQSASASFGSDAQSGEADPPPSCIPGVRMAYLQAMTDYSKAAGNYQDAVSELSSDSDSVALGDMRAGTKAMNNGNTEIDTVDAEGDQIANAALGPAGGHGPADLLRAELDRVVRLVSSFSVTTPAIPPEILINSTPVSDIRGSGLRLLQRTEGARLLPALSVSS